MVITGYKEDMHLDDIIVRGQDVKLMGNFVSVRSVVTK